MKSHNGVALKNLKVKVSAFDFDFEKFKNDLKSDELNLVATNGDHKHLATESPSISSTVSNIDCSESFVTQNSVVNTTDPNDDSKAQTECQTVVEEALRTPKLPIINAIENICARNDDFGDSCAKPSNNTLIIVSGKSSEQLVFNISTKKTESMKCSKSINNNETQCTDNNINAKFNKSITLDKCVQVSLMDNRKEELSKQIKQLEEEKERYLKQWFDDREERSKQLLDASKRLYDAKRKQWCANCLNEAILWCCWNVSYCTVECQYSDWPLHEKRCRRTQRSVQQQT